MPRPALPPVTIVMGCYQGAAYLPEQLQSIAAQRGVDWHLVASDDGSDDATPELLQAFRARHPGRVTLRQGPRAGAAAHFIDLLCAPDLPAGPIALADQDDIWDADKLIQALTWLKHAPPGPAVYSARSRHITAGGRLLGLSRPWRGTPSFGNALVENRVSGHAAVLNLAARALVRAVGPVKVPAHDWWLYLLITGAGGHVLCDPAPRLSYRQHAGNVLGAPRGAAALVRRMAQVLGPEGPRLHQANRRALEQAAPWLTPQARALLERLDHAPAAGPARARALRRLGLTRHHRAADSFIALTACLGRI